jgi:hypothetical protein
MRAGASGSVTEQGQQTVAALVARAQDILAARRSE